jgi:Fe-S cluster assembly protein SufD
LNGVFNEELSQLNLLPKGLTACSLAEAAKKHTSVFEKHYSNLIL